MAKILLVDDDRDLTEACRLVLEQAGHQVEVAHTADTGMETVRSYQPDLLVLDVMMAEPDDGIAMAQQLRREGFGKPILMLTNIGKVSGMQFGKDDGLVPVDEFLEKPIPPATLVEKVKALLGQKEGD
jgi:DNA-binding response OmpR family regulator